MSDSTQSGTPPPEAPLPQRTLHTTIEDEMRSSFIDYAMSVIISRALPNVRDGLKPVHRRILYAMHQLRNFHSQPYKKSARIVGDVIGKYHPHGDSAVYEALVRMAQDFSLRYPLADGQGNFGSIDGDPPAAMRYTEIRIARIGEEMLSDIEQETVDWAPNYDEKELEPVVLPARIPNLLINGTQGIAVGMATNIPPHNLREVLDATIALIHNPELSLAELLQLLPGPDFPTAGFIYGRAGILQAYQTGRGSIVVRARTEIEDLRSGKQAIIVTELPYQVNKARLIERIAELVREKRVSGITDLRDESDREGIRVVIELRRDVMPEVMLNQLYKLTPLQDTFGVNSVAIVDGRPEVLRVIDVLRHFVDHRRDVVTRRSAYQLREARKREHILEGLKIALDHIDEVIALIRAAASPVVAKSGLVARFGLSELQAQAILEMRLQRLTGLERDKILQELQELRERIAYLLGLLSDDAKLMAVVVAELEELRERYGDARRTEIVEASGEIQLEDLIAQEDMVVTVTHSGYVKRVPISEYRAQHRGGKGVTGVTTHEEDFVRQLFVAHSHDHLMMFTSMGRVYVRRVYELPHAPRTSRGKAIVNLLELREGERFDQMLALKEFAAGRYVVMATRRGVIKRTELMEFANVRSTGIIALDLVDDDELIDVRLTDGEQHVLLCTRGGMAIRFPESQLRPMGRTARGVRGIRLGADDRVVGMAVLDPESASDVLTVCEGGYGKRTPAAEFSAQNRGGLGLIAIKANERNGPVVGSLVAIESDEAMLVTQAGKVIRMPVRDISQIGRNTQGVRLIRLEEGERVVAVDGLAERDDEGGDEGEDADEGEARDVGADERGARVAEGDEGERVVAAEAGEPEPTS
ncbi:MAG: DNA gyrase subunit A [Proteobacteria bacterium]|nr:DNA gyrase subunit A [Pseudomonadota bacterium]